RRRNTKGARLCSPRFAWPGWLRFLTLAGDVSGDFSRISRNPNRRSQTLIDRRRKKPQDSYRERAGELVILGLTTTDECGEHTEIAIANIEDEGCSPIDCFGGEDSSVSSV